MATKIVKATREQRRALLNSFGGKFYSACWITKDGVETRRNVQHFQHAQFVGGHANTAQANPVVVAGKEQYYTAVDTDKAGWVNINLDTLKEVRCMGDVLVFQ